MRMERSAYYIYIPIVCLLGIIVRVFALHNILYIQHSNSIYLEQGERFRKSIMKY
jgi:hypothetical protein